LHIDLFLLSVFSFPLIHETEAITDFIYSSEAKMLEASHSAVRQAHSKYMQYPTELYPPLMK